MGAVNWEKLSFFRPQNECRLLQLMCDKRFGHSNHSAPQVGMIPFGADPNSYLQRVGQKTYQTHVPRPIISLTTHYSYSEQWAVQKVNFISLFTLYAPCAFIFICSEFCRNALEGFGLWNNLISPSPIIIDIQIFWWQN